MGESETLHHKSVDTEREIIYGYFYNLPNVQLRFVHFTKCKLYFNMINEKRYKGWSRLLPKVVLAPIFLIDFPVFHSN